MDTAPSLQAHLDEIQAIRLECSLHRRDLAEFRAAVRATRGLGIPQIVDETGQPRELGAWLAQLRARTTRLRERWETLHAKYHPASPGKQAALR